MLDKRWNPSHDYILIIPALIWLVLEAVSALDNIWLTDPVDNVTHYIDIGESADRAWIDCEREIIADWVKYAPVRLIKAMIHISKVLWKSHRNRVLPDVIEGSGRQCRPVSVSSSLRIRASIPR